MAHTPEPWAAYKDGKRETNNINHFIKSLSGDMVSYGHLSEDDAKRIVACVNACSGISNKQLKALEVETHQDYLNDLLTQRDELLAHLIGMCGAMQKAMPHLPADHEAVYCGEWFMAAQETITRVKGARYAETSA